MLKDLENSMSNKDASETYGVPKNTVSTWLRNKEKILLDKEKLSTNPKRKKMCTGGYEDVEKLYLNGSLQKGTKPYFNGSL